MEQTIDIRYGEISENKADFIKVLKKAKDIVLFRSENDNVSNINLIVYSIKGKTRIQETHMFTATGLIKGDIRYSVDIERNIIKSLIKPKSEFTFYVYKDAKRNDYHVMNNLHADAVYLTVNGLDMLLDTQTCPDNSARMTRY